MSRTAAASPTIEFVLPFYGDPGYLLEAVMSIREQTDPDWRLTVLDDAFPDCSASRAVEQIGDPRIRVVRHSENLGLNRNFQAALDSASADYLVVMGGDDRLLPDYVARMRSTVRRTGAAVVQPGSVVIDEDGLIHVPLVDRVKGLLRPRPRVPRIYGGQAIATSLLTGNWTNFPALCWERESAQRIGFRSGYAIVLDLGLLLDTLAAGGGLAVDPAVTFEYRRHRASVSSQQAASGIRFAEEAAFLDQMSREFWARGWYFAAVAAKLRITSRLHASLVRVSRSGASIAQRVRRGSARLPR